MKLSESLEPSNWNGILLQPLILVAAIEPESGREISQELEEKLINLNLRGSTGPDTSPQYHQNLTGIEGWLLDLKERSYTRVDGYTVNSCKRNGIPVASMEQIEEFLKEHRGEVSSLAYEI